jgi:hypothetical protein
MKLPCEFGSFQAKPATNAFLMAGSRIRVFEVLGEGFLKLRDSISGGTGRNVFEAISVWI